MKHLVIFNFHQAQLPGVKDLLSAIKADSRFFLFKWNQNQRSNVSTKGYKTMSLLGDFKQYDRNSNILGDIDQSLISFWEHEKGVRRVWINSPIDLHLGLKGMLFGKRYTGTKSIKSVEGFITQNFQALAWAYEHNDFQVRNFNHPKYLFDIDEKIKHAEHFFRSNFGSRLDFPWAINLKARESSFIKSAPLYQICVPGEPYKSRLRFSTILSQKLKLAPYSKNDSMIKLVFYTLSKLGLNSHLVQGRIKMKFRFWNMIWCIRHSQFSYVDGGSLDYFVRKYLEVVVSGSTLVCPDSEAISHYGFKRNVHYLESEEFLSHSAKWIAALERVDLNRNASELLNQLHSYELRISQLYDFLEIISEGESCVGRFYNGTFGFTRF
jgi:hypothetical protein